MKTIKSPISPTKAVYLLWLVACPLLCDSQTNPAAEPTRPQQTEAACSQIIDNYLNVTGGLKAHQAIRNVVAEGTIKVSTLERTFKLIETADGQRHITYKWTHLGRKYHEQYAFDGLRAWKQILAPKESPPMPYIGADAIHFSNQAWLLQPFTLPSRANFVFEYQGGFSVGGRDAYIVKGYGRQNIPSWFYFDKEKFLLTRWGGESQIVGIKEHMDYVATQFKAVSGVIMPTQVDLIVENATYGHIVFTKIEANVDLNDFSFYNPKSITPVLRKRPVTKY